MVATHATDAFLAGEYRNGVVWNLSSLLFGFAAPAFLMVAGMTLGLRSAAITGPDAGARRRILWRMGALLMLGCWLQIPVISIWWLAMEQRPEDMARLFDSNVLHVIALSSIAIILLAALLRSPGRVRIAVGMLAVAVAVATPYVWAGEVYRQLWLPIRSFVAPQPIATFPLLPYSFHLLAGFLLVPLLVVLDRRPRGWLVMLGTGCALMAAGIGIDRVIGGIPPHGDFWGSGIGHLLLRSGGVVSALGLCMPLSRLFSPRVSAIEEIGRRSLGIYVLHLMLIYGSPMTMGMRYWLGGAFDRTFTPAAVVVIAVAVLILCHQGLRLWEWMRARYPRVCRGAIAAWWGWFVIWFVAG